MQEHAVFDLRDWRRLPWAKGREEMLAAMSDQDRARWFARRAEDDLLYDEWLKSMGLRRGDRP